MTILVKPCYCQESRQNYESTKWQLPNPQGVESTEGLGGPACEGTFGKKRVLKK